jgi:hypothetical protein
MKFPLTGPLGEAHSAFPSPLAVSKPILSRAEGVQSASVLAFIAVVQ